MVRKAGLFVFLLFILGCATDDFIVPEEPVTDYELSLIAHAATRFATPEEKEKAQNICLTKCKVCFDGQKCDLQCVKDNCRKD